MLNLEGGYLGFTFDGRHSSEFGLLVVSDGSRYHQNLSSEFSDTVLQVSGRNGGYYFGTQLGMRDFSIDCVFDDMTTKTLLEMQRWLYPNKVGWLVFDETPYKKYLVKISGIISPSFVPFDKNEDIKGYKFRREIIKGEVNIPFFSFEEYGYENNDYDLPSITTNSIIEQQAIDSGLIPEEYSHKDIYFSNEMIEEISTTTGFELYNAGNGIAEAIFNFTIEKDLISSNDPLSILNYDDGENYIINDPSSIIEDEGINLNEVSKYRIRIDGIKKEIWLECLDSNGDILTIKNNNNEDIEVEPINIGACYNHYFPHVNHSRPTNIMVMTLGKKVDNTIEQPEPLFYPYSYNSEDYIPSDGNSVFKFEEIKNLWSEYTILDGLNSYTINNIINPAAAFLHLDDALQDSELTNKLVYFIYPNKYSSNKTITNFTAEYRNTYI